MDDDEKYIDQLYADLAASPPSPQGAGARLVPGGQTQRDDSWFTGLRNNARSSNEKAGKYLEEGRKAREDWLLANRQGRDADPAFYDMAIENQKNRIFNDPFIGGFAGFQAVPVVGALKSVRPVRPFYHGVRDGAKAAEDIKTTGFQKGQSAELNMQGTSLSEDPMISWRNFGGGQDRNSMLIIKPKPTTTLPDGTPAIEYRNLSPTEYVKGTFGKEEGFLRKPNYPFTEAETFATPSVRNNVSIRSADTIEQDKLFAEAKKIDFTQRRLSDLETSVWDINDVSFTGVTSATMPQVFKAYGEIRETGKLVLSAPPAYRLKFAQELSGHLSVLQDHVFELLPGPQRQEAFRNLRNAAVDMQKADGFASQQSQHLKYNSNKTTDGLFLESGGVTDSNAMHAIIDEVARDQNAGAPLKYFIDKLKSEFIHGEYALENFKYYQHKLSEWPSIADATLDPWTVGRQIENGTTDVFKVRWDLEDKLPSEIWDNFTANPVFTSMKSGVTDSEPFRTGKEALNAYLKLFQRSSAIKLNIEEAGENYISNSDKALRSTISDIILKGDGQHLLTSRSNADNALAFEQFQQIYPPKWMGEGAVMKQLENEEAAIDFIINNVKSEVLAKNSTKPLDAAEFERIVVDELLDRIGGVQQDYANAISSAINERMNLLQGIIYRVNEENVRLPNAENKLYDEAYRSYMRAYERFMKALGKL